MNEDGFYIPRGYKKLTSPLDDQDWMEYEKIVNSRQAKTSNGKAKQRSGSELQTASTGNFKKYVKAAQQAAKLQAAPLKVYKKQAAQRRASDIVLAE